MADPMSGLDMLREIIGQITNTVKLVTVKGKQYRYDAKSNSYKGEGGKSFSISQLKGKAREAFQTVKTAVKENTAKRLKIGAKKKSKSWTRPQKGGPLVKANTPKKDSPRATRLKNKQAANAKVTKDTAFNRKYNVKGSSTNPWVTDKKGRITNPVSKVNKGNIKIKPQAVLEKGKKLGSQALKQLKKIRNVKGAGTVGKGLSKLGAGAELATYGYGLADSAAGAVRQGGNIYRRIKGKPLLEFDNKLGIGKAPSHLRIKEKNEYLKKHGSLKGFTKSVSRWNPDNKKTNNKKTTPTATTSKKTTPSNTSPKANKIAQVKQNIKKAKGWNKRKLQREQAYLEKFGKQPRTWQEPHGQKSRKPSEGDFKSSSKSSGKKMHAIEKRNREIHGDDRIDAVKKYHEGWKKARKEGRLEEWKKKNKARRGWQ